MSLTSIGVYSSSDRYISIKNTVDDLENSVIQDFDFNIPKGAYSSQKKYIELGIRLENKFTEQKKLFYKAEAELFEIQDSLEHKVTKGELTKNEADKLLTSVEYARRIILYTRKSEVHERYSNLRELISKKPSLEELHKKISHMVLPGNCKIKNAKLDNEKHLFSFEILGKDQNGKKENTLYQISQAEISQGLLSSQFERGEHMGTRDKLIWRFNKTNADDSVSSFSLFENKKGEFYHAEFYHDEISKPLINVFGLFGIGSRRFNKEIKCFKGPTPASVRTEIKANFEKKPQ